MRQRVTGNFLKLMSSIFRLLLIISPAFAGIWKFCSSAFRNTSAHDDDADFGVLERLDMLYFGIAFLRGTAIVTPIEDFGSRPYFIGRAKAKARAKPPAAMRSDYFCVYVALISGATSIRASRRFRSRASITASIIALISRISPSEKCFARGRHYE